MNSLIWTIGLILQILLLVTLMRGGLMRKLPLFTALIAFYVVRSVFLYTGLQLMEDDAYAMCEQVLSLIDIVFQVLVAWELLRGGRIDAAARAQSAPLARQALLFGALIAGSAALAWGLSVINPLNRSRLFDRGVIFTAALILLVAACSMFRRKVPHAAAANRVLAGYALLSIASISTQVGKTLAAIQRDSRVYYDWSYVTVVVYLAVLAYWLVGLQAVSPRPLFKGRRSTAPGEAS